MSDIELGNDGDIIINENGDINLTESIKQAVKIRLLWFLNEWRFNPDIGVPYYDEVFVKNPDIEFIKQIIRDEALDVDGVTDVMNIRVTIDKERRGATIRFELRTQGDVYTEEVVVWQNTE